ncbi:hypothetical protein L484_025962 [Morus notabilis]|uniref:Pentatricopeptide repeat-containing protein n=1 Tax=Morus notabilis TaxID=981085 RepID=W9RW88_9ROSA|nr:hypothetical protein L484_025962 [Morus notabilis]
MSYNQHSNLCCFSSSQSNNLQSSNKVPAKLEQVDEGSTVNVAKVNVLKQKVEIFGIIYDSSQSKCSNIAYAHQMFYKLPKKDVFSWNAILGDHCKAGNLQEAHQLFVKMPDRNIVSWNNVISALARIALERRRFLKNAETAVQQQAMWSNLGHEMTAEFQGLCAEEAYLQQELEKLHDLRNKVKVEGEHWDDL